MLERINQLIKAVKLEQATEINQYHDAQQNLSLTEKVKKGITLYPIGYKDQSFSAFDDLLLTFSYRPDHDLTLFSTNGKVVLFSSEIDEEVEARIKRVTDDEIVIQLAQPELPDWIKKGKLGVHALPDTKTTALYIETLERIQKGEIPIAQQFYKKGFTLFPTTELIDFGDLNESQQKAANYLLGETTLQIVHGPPGTGKTKTLVAAIKERVKNGEKIAVVAPSNAAVDHITFQLSLAGVNIVRLGNSFKTANHVIPLTLDAKIEEDQLMQVVNRLKKEAEVIRKKAFAFKRNFGKEEYNERKQLRQELNQIRKDIRKIEKEIRQNCLEAASVVSGTVVALQNKRLNDLNFAAVFIDEAGQAVEPAIWSVAHLADQLVLAGDPFQLPPTVLDLKAQQLGLDKTLLELAIEKEYPTHLLDVQYRMNDLIMQFSNHYFYHNKLTSASEVSGQQLSNDEHLPVEFIDTAGCGFEEIITENGAIKNEGEADIVAKRIATINETKKSIGVISPYRGQVNTLQLLLAEYGVNCQTVDSFQGQEQDIILLSLTRSNSSSTIGFLKDYRRMNVAMTRARFKLIVVGDSATIGHDSFYAAFLNYVESNGSYRSAWEFMT